ncbi:MAG: hypothetical protein ABIR17_02265 [Pseudolysinimonas sp.]|uniref:hypothetical protein n=1 Tax=Pseudolysinimonas sp. TaxID=2680009 RepID=UPI0032662C7C
MFTALAVSALAFHHWGGGLFLLFIPLFFVVIPIILFAIFGRRWRKRHGGYGYGMGGFGPHAYWARAQSASSAESTLAQRFANGDIDEKEYRARLEVIRASGAVPPTA